MRKHRGITLGRASEEVCRQTQRNERKGPLFLPKRHKIRHSIDTGSLTYEGPGE